MVSEIATHAILPNSPRAVSTFLEKHKRLLFSVLLSVNLAICITSARNKSLTYDEVTYIGLGNYVLRTGDVRAFAGPFPFLPSLVNGVFWNFIHFDPAFWQRLPQLYARDYQSLPLIFESGRNPETLIFLARLPVMLLFPALALMIFSWTRRLFGVKAAFFALSLALFCPNLIAHARLATTDFVTTVTFFGAVFSFWLYVREPSWWRLLLCGVVSGLALLAKFSSILLFPIYLILILLDNADGISPRNLLAGARRSLLPVATDKQEGMRLYMILPVLLLSFLTIWACYLFEYRPLYIPQFVEGRPELAYQGIMKTLFDKQVKLPAVSYLVSFYQQIAHRQVGHPTFILGHASSTGTWYYFPFAFLIKTPIPLLIFILLSSVFLRRFRSRGNACDAFLLLPALGVFLFAVLSNINIGLRYILPAFPFLFVWSGRVIDLTNRRWYRALLALLLAWHIGSSLYIYPHYLEYFNELIGGPKNGYKYLVDSNLDWGQDLKLLDEYVKEKDIDSLTLIYFGAPGLAEYYGYQNSAGDCDIVRQGYVAISATFLYSLYLSPHCYDWLKQYQPIDRVGYSIFIYKFPP